MADLDEYRQQIEPMAQMAYRLHNLATQVHHLAEREIAGSLDEQTQRTARAHNGSHTLASCAQILFSQAKYARDSASGLIAFLLRQPQAQTAADYQWWLDLVERPVTSNVRPEIAAVDSAPQLATTLTELAAEADTAARDFGDTFEAIGWPRGITGHTELAVLKLHERIERLR